MTAASNAGLCTVAASVPRYSLNLNKGNDAIKDWNIVSGATIVESRAWSATVTDLKSAKAALCR